MTGTEQALDRGSGAAHHARASRPSQRDRAFSRARRHSRHVRLLKNALPVAAVLMIALFVGRSWLSVPDGLSVDLGASGIEDGRLVMSNPRMEGFTSADRPYSMTALRAIQDLGGDGAVDLEGISARLPLDAENWATVETSSGVFDRESNRLSLTSDILLETDTGIKAMLRSAEIDMAAGTLETDLPVEIQLDGARITSNSMNVTNRGKVLRFTDDVRVMIDGRRLQTARAAEESGADASSSANGESTE